MITLVDKINISFDKGNIIIFSISQKAFDTIDHHILLKKLYAYGIRGHNIKWFGHFNNENSETHPIKCGVPQGYMLSPLLFIIYMNDICNISFSYSTSCMLMILQW